MVFVQIANIYKCTENIFSKVTCQEHLLLATCLQMQKRSCAAQ